MGLEPTTSWLPAMRSSQLSYIPDLVVKISDFFGMIAQKVFDGLQNGKNSSKSENQHDNLGKTKTRMI